MKTIKEHLKKLPLQKRLQAIENIRKQNSDLVFSLNWKTNTENAISGKFIFCDTKQGHDYWYDINQKYFRQ